MPCICHGEISGKEEFDSFRKEHPEKWNQILDHIKEASDLIRSNPISAECWAEEWHKIWMEAFAHLLQGCPEHKD